MNRNTKKLVIATLAVIVTAAAMASPAEARRYRHKAVKVSAASVTTSADYLGAGNPFAPMWGAGMQVQRPRAAAPARYAQRHQWRATRHAAPRAPRTARIAAAAPAVGFASGFGGGGLVAQARQYLGTNPTGMGALWCARFMNMVLERSGHRGTGSNMASSFANFGTRVSGPQVGAIAVMSRGKRGGHVGIVSGIDASGNPIIISGNHNRRVAESVYSKGRIYAYVMP